ncbi:MAG: hypothetical protein QXJ48_04010 [Candidatus Korarchaeum sp.]
MSEAKLVFRAVEGAVDQAVRTTIDIGVRVARVVIAVKTAGASEMFATVSGEGINLLPELAERLTPRIAKLGEAEKVPV